MSQPHAPITASRHRLIGLILLASCGGGAPPASLGSGDGGGVDAAMMSCVRPGEGCGCSVTAPIDCFLDPTATGTDTLLCHRGTRYCRSGTWSGCESVHDYTISTSRALITGPSSCSPCDPSCYNTTLSPTPSDLTPTNSMNASYDPGTGGIIITPMTSTTRGMPCTPITACPATITCGTISNGCGGTINCGTCAAGTTCGGGGMAGRCGSVTGMCTALGCGTANCGQVADGCGGLTASCGTCPAGQGCGGSGVPSVCGAPPPPPCIGPGGPGTGLCTQVRACAGGATTTLTGIVTAPGHSTTGPVPPPDPCPGYADPNSCWNDPQCDWWGWSGPCYNISNPQPASWGAPDPLYGVHVFVPGTTPAAFPPGVHCDSCSTGLSGNPITQTTTDVDGNFVLNGVPCGTNIPLVIQLGRWRRQVVVPSVACCGTTAVTSDLTRMPRNHLEGDIPLTAMVTGGVDVMECVLRKIGIDDSEFSDPAAQGGSGRVRFYQANGATFSAATPNESQLWGAGGDINQYDMVLFACEGYQSPETQADQQRVIDYANAGGRIYATHFSYVWLTNNRAADPVPPPLVAPAPFSQTAAWAVNQSMRASTTATIDTSFARGATFSQWLFNRGASTTLGQVVVNVVRNDFNAVNAPAQRWLYDSTQPIHYTFDTPIAYPPAAPISPVNQCGRVVFSDFHVEDFGGASWFTFPSECTVGPLTAQERVLEYMLFDLASCITPVACTPRTCAQAGVACGPAADGCGGIIPNCGTCTLPDTCGGGGVPSQCGHPTGTCTPLTCATPGLTCGTNSDGCGGTITCTCTTYPPMATYTQLYSSQPTPCTIDQCAIWGTFTYTANVPLGTHITFSFQTAATSSGFPHPPTGTITVNPPATATATTGAVSGSADIASLMMAAGAVSGQPFLQLTTTLYSNASLTATPSLQSTNVAFTCAPCM